eukprot:5192890-Amphidinium_carterae.1
MSSQTFDCGNRYFKVVLIRRAHVDPKRRLHATDKQVVFPSAPCSSISWAEATTGHGMRQVDSWHDSQPVRLLH